MVEVKQIKTFTYDDDYKNNIQLQFLDDQKFNAFIQMLCNYSNEYQETLKQYGNLFNLNNSVTQDFIINIIGQTLGLPPIGYFGNITIDQYMILIRGQQIKNSYNGTNQSMLDLLNTLLPQYGWVIEDTGDMILKVYLNPLDTIFFNATPTIVESSTITKINIDKQKLKTFLNINRNRTYRLMYFEEDGLWTQCNVQSTTGAWLPTYPPTFNADEAGVTFEGEPQNGDRISIYISDIANIDPFVEKIFNEGWLTPKPAGVGFEHDILTQRYFAWDISDETTTPQTGGWDEGVWL